MAISSSKSPRRASSSALGSKNITAASAWTRPSDWLALPDISSTNNRFVGLHRIDQDSNFVALSCTVTGDYTVDWGDGTTTNHSSGSVAQKQYAYGSIPDTGESNLGYRQVIVQVYPQNSNDITSFSLQNRHSQIINLSYSPGWLDVAINASSLTSLSIGGTIVLSYLQRANIYQNSLTNCSGLFTNCYTLASVLLSNTASVTDMSSMFSSCSALTSVPLFDTASVTNMSSMFSSCRSLTSVPLFNTASVLDMGSMFNGCSALASIPSLISSSVSSITNIFLNCSSLSSAPLSGTNRTISYSGCKLSPSSIAAIFANLGRAATSQTITISSNWGAVSSISKSGCGMTIGSKTITQSNTSDLVAGMRVLGFGITDAVAVTFQDSEYTVTRTSHGLDNGTIVSFTSITNTIGIQTYTQYYVINATTNTFQLASAAGGSAIPFFINGSGSMIYPSYITAITTNTSFTMSAPASATTAAVNLSARLLDTFTAVAKGWTVSG